MVYKFEKPLDTKGTVFCWESTTLSDRKDADKGKLTKGVLRVKFPERIERCFSKGYEVSVRPRSNVLNNFRHEVSGRSYETNKIELFKAAYDGIFGDNKGDLRSLFCS